MVWDKYIEKANRASDDDMFWKILMIVGTRPLTVDTGVENPTDKQVVKAMAKEVLGLDIDFKEGRNIWGVPSYKVKGAEATLKPGSSFTMYDSDGIKAKDWAPVFDKVINEEVSNGVQDIVQGGRWADCKKASVYISARFDFSRRK